MPGVLLAACVSSHLDDPSRSTAESADPGSVAAEVGGDDAVPSNVAEASTASATGSACATEPRSLDASSQPTDPRQARCGDGRIDADEDCEVGLPGWTSENCSTRCRQTLYPNSNPCTFEVGEPFAFYEKGDCLELPGFSVGCFYLFGQSCQILCSDTADCPVGFTCNPMSNPAALGPGWCAARR
jgi:hypothetical protein